MSSGSRNDTALCLMTNNLKGAEKANLDQVRNCYAQHGATHSRSPCFGRAPRALRRDHAVQRSSFTHRSRSIGNMHAADHAEQYPVNRRPAPTGAHVFLARADRRRASTGAMHHYVRLLHRFIFLRKPSGNHLRCLLTNT